MFLPNLSAQVQKFEILLKKRLHWATVVRVQNGPSVVLSQVSATMGFISSEEYSLLVCFKGGMGTGACPGSPLCLTNLSVFAEDPQSR